MPTLKQVQSTIDNYIDIFWPLLQSKQSQFPEDRFFQGLEIFDILPLYSENTDGKKRPDKLKSKPTDRDKDWEDFNIPGLNENTDIPCNIQCDEYLGPLGKGYVIIISFNYDTEIEIQTWQKTLQNGPETFREFNWQIILPKPSRD